MEKCKLLVPGYLNYIQVLLYQVQVLENRYSTLNSVVNGHTTEIHNLDTRLDTAESKLNNHEERIRTLEVKVEDHERRLN